MIKVEKVVNYKKDSEFEILDLKKPGTISQMKDGRIAKILDPSSLLVYNISGINLLEKLNALHERESISELAVPLTALSDGDNIIGYTMKEVYGIPLSCWDDNFSLYEQSNLDKYINLHRKIAEVVEKCNQHDIVIPDLLTCDNIIIDGKGNISMIDTDDFQVENFQSFVVSTSLGNQNGIINSPKFLDKSKILWKTSLDKKV